MLPDHHNNILHNGFGHEGLEGSVQSCFQFLQALKRATTKTRILGGILSALSWDCLGPSTKAPNAEVLWFRVLGLGF